VSISEVGKSGTTLQSGAGSAENKSQNCFILLLKLLTDDVNKALTHFPIILH